MGLILFLNHAASARQDANGIVAGKSFAINHRPPKYLTSNPSGKRPIPVILSSSFVIDTLKAGLKNNLKTEHFYLKRSKNQKTTAWILLGGGTAMVIGGTLFLVGDMVVYALSLGNNGSANALDIAGYIIFTGILADLVSIPFFISAAHNKKMAASISFCNQNIYTSQNIPLSSNFNFSLTLKIRF